MEQKILMTIKETAKTIGLKEFAIRKLCVDKKIDTVKVGKVYYINYPKLVEKINNGELKEI
nr:MAG TPA: excisionase [Caudoviricetes sp.]